MKKTTKSKLPLLYALSRAVLYPILFYVVRYRRKMVQRNLSSVFPDKSAAERKALEKRFYHWFSDLLTEILYSSRISEEEIRERVVILNAEETYELIRKHGGALMVLGHLGNWEWLSDIGNRYPDDIHSYVVYRKQKNARVNTWMQQLRAKRGNEPIDKNVLLRHMVLNRKRDGAQVYYLISDQKPSKNDLGHWTTFLGQDTPFITGAETLGRKFGYPVFYVDVEMPERGHYVATFRLIAENVAEQPEGAVTDAFARLLEENILRNPAIWLWSHNRFKWRREDARRAVEKG